MAGLSLFQRAGQNWVREPFLNNGTSKESNVQVLVITSHKVLGTASLGEGKCQYFALLCFDI